MSKIISDTITIIITLKDIYSHIVSAKFYLRTFDGQIFGLGGGGGGDLVANDFPETTRNQHKAYI